MKTAIPVLLGLIAVSGCMTEAKMNSIMSSWEGAHYSDVIASWGPPDQIIDDGQGGKIISWSSTHSYTNPGQSTTQYYGSPYSFTGSSYTTHTSGQTYTWTKTRTFWADSNGIIYRWAYRGL